MCNNISRMVTALSLLLFSVVLSEGCSKEQSIHHRINYVEPCTSWGISADELIALKGEPERIAEVAQGWFSYGYPHQNDLTPHSSYIISSTEGLILASVRVNASRQQVIDFLSGKYFCYETLPGNCGKYCGDSADPAKARTLIAVCHTANSEIVVYASSQELIKTGIENAVNIEVGR